ncbi:hypothetical protein CIB84_003452, partial [Bambusicola thoracicus]
MGVQVGDSDSNQEFPSHPSHYLANPPYKPKLKAQTTLIIFTVTRDRLEEQLLAEEQFPDLEKHKANGFYCKLWKISYPFRTRTGDGNGGGLDKAAKYSHWLLLQCLKDNKCICYLTIILLVVFQQNIHIAANWFGTLEKLLEQYSEESHSEFHVFVSTEPAPGPEVHVVLQGILGDGITTARGTPTRMLANLYAALYSFDQQTLLAFQAANKKRYPFSTKDLTVCIRVPCNCLDTHRGQTQWS